MMRIYFSIILWLVFAEVVASGGGNDVLSEARSLFPIRTMLTADLDYDDAEHHQFISKFHKLADSEVGVLLEDYIVTAITSTVVRISTNAVDACPSRIQLEDCGVALENLAVQFRQFPTNSVQCEAVARYLGTLQPLDYPHDLIHTMGGVHRFVLNPPAEERSVATAPSDIEDRRRMQMRIYNANQGLKDYRLSLFYICNEAVVGCRKVMDDSEFEQFTNRLVNLSHPTERELRALLKGVAVAPKTNRGRPPVTP